ncbi:MAG: metabolite traffic protein EboE [Kiritimatiellae bacterium]|nr:metabolite traffic protein EboE [Kiritimatiellia bacterium]
MKLQTNPPLHLTYCLNIHKGETWHENLSSIKDHALRIRDSIAPDKPFGLGLRLSNLAAMELREKDQLANFKSFLSENNLYVFTINGFPYGQFHGERIKEKAYSPDWRTKERLNYTTTLADILAELLPDDVNGSISTVPGSYKESTPDEEVINIVRNLADCAEHLENIYTRTGKDICLGLEPEPDCLIETTGEAIAFFEEYLLDDGCQQLCSAYGHQQDAAREIIFRRLGYCFDTCHMTVEFENPTDSLRKIHQHGIKIAKVQISAALKTNLKHSVTDQLSGFCDETYLHQVKIMSGNNEIISHKDLTKELLKYLSGKSDGELRLHFHVPLYFDRVGDLSSTNTDLTNDFFKTAIEVGATHFEIETYTFDVLPEALRAKDVTKSIIKEYNWLLNKIN